MRTVVVVLDVVHMYCALYLRDLVQLPQVIPDVGVLLQLLLVTLHKQKQTASTKDIISACDSVPSSAL